MKDNLH